MDSPRSDLVLDSRIQVEFSDTLTYRFTVQSTVSSTRHVRRRPRKEIWQAVKLLGSGSYGTVSLQKCLTSEGEAELQAVKMIKKAVIPDGFNYLEELEAIAKFSQKKYEGLFVELIGWYENDDSVFVAMEYLEHGDLELHLNKPIPELEAREITLQLAEGLKLLHENGFAHRDLKPANVFVCHKGPEWWVKIGDFGSSKRTTEKDGLQTWVGTPTFLAPEAQMLYPFRTNGDKPFSQYTEKVDIWALGVITFYMIFHEYPFTPRKPVGLLQYIQGAELPFPVSTRSGISEGCINFIKAAMAPDASNRLSAKEVTEFEWLARSETPIPEMSSLQITECKVPDSTSTENSDGRLGPTPSPRLEETNNGNDVSRTAANMPASDLSGSAGLSPRESPTSSKSELSLKQGSQIRSPSRGDGIFQLQPDELQSLHTQGVQFFRKNDLIRAEVMLRQAAQGRKKALGLKHADTRNSYHCLGVVYYHMSEYGKAKQLFEWVLEAQEKLYAPSNQSILKSRYWIGLLMKRRGNPQGMDVLLSVMKLQQDSLGPNHPETLLTLSEMMQMSNQTPGLQNSPLLQISTSLQLSEMEKTTVDMRKSIGELKLRFGQNSMPRRRTFMLRPARRHTAVVRLPRSLPCLPPDSKLDDSHSSKLKAYYRTMADLGQRLHGQGDYYAAESHLQLAVNGLKEIFGPAHTEPLETLYWLGRNYYEKGQYKTAENLFGVVTEGFTICLGKTSRETLNALHATGFVLSQQGKYIEAESVFRSALKGVVYDYDQDIMRSHFQLGVVLCKNNMFYLAGPILRDTYYNLKRVLGPRSDETTMCDYWLSVASAKDEATAEQMKVRVQLPPSDSRTANHRSTG